MADDRQHTGHQDRSRINVNDDHKVRYWTQKSGFPPPQPREAVKSAGVMAKDVAKHFSKELQAETTHIYFKTSRRHSRSYPMTSTPPAQPSKSLDDHILHVNEEELRVSKVQRETGRVRVSVKTETIEEEISETLRSRAAHVERVSIGKEVSSYPPIREEDGVTIIPVVEEILVVEKRLFLKEEIRLRFSDTEEPFQKKVLRRVQSAVVERVSSDAADASTLE